QTRLPTGTTPMLRAAARSVNHSDTTVGPEIGGVLGRRPGSRPGSWWITRSRMAPWGAMRRHLLVHDERRFVQPAHGAVLQPHLGPLAHGLQDLHLRLAGHVGDPIVA